MIECTVINKSCESLEHFFNYVINILNSKFPDWIKISPVVVKTKVLFENKHVFITPCIDLFPFSDCIKWFTDNIITKHEQMNNQVTSLTFEVYKYDPRKVGLNFYHLYKVQYCFEYDKKMYIKLITGHILPFPERFRTRYEQIKIACNVVVRLLYNNYDINILSNCGMTPCTCKRV